MFLPVFGIGIVIGLFLMLAFASIGITHQDPVGGCLLALAALVLFLTALSMLVTMFFLSLLGI